MAILTYAGAIGATQVYWSLVVTLFLLATGSALAAAGFFTGSAPVLAAAGWVFIGSAAAGIYTATGLLYESLFGRSILPVGRPRPKRTYRSGIGEPGVV
jgi:uncharacterized protein